MEDIKKDNEEIDWDGKESKVFWRGTTTGRRVELLNQWIRGKFIQHIDKAFIYKSRWFAVLSSIMILMDRGVL